ncbi:nucleoside diphosphate-linked moiety X motif 19 [Manduca sexta]|uniref:Nudix hydrolase domain-containing protein n=1 Tax=Manduca sexta TaxID=7130 RepID=A0A921YXB5_MANSE|nr:nucleoside diphosphate-linked moiety X motif 19 [Manduca sexta]KAG6447026.1 hypothetical protein O3G_MSEX004736 [Manduca sexta]
MKNIGKSWRDSATLIVLTKRSGAAASAAAGKRSGDVGGVNYDILLQTRTGGASFPNSVVFPGGVAERADGDERWSRLLTSFGFTHQDFESLHRRGSTVPAIFQSNPIQRHISLRVTAIRETFEELGLLLCSRQQKNQRDGIWANIISDIDVKLWQNKLAKDPDELWNLCKEYNCYPDIWSLHYWSNWLTPKIFPKRFDTAFFVTAIESKPDFIKASSEVFSVEWSSPTEILNKTNVVVYPPQIYELTRLSHVTDLEELIKLAKEKSIHGDPCIYPVVVPAKDGMVHLLPGDDLYPETVDFNDNNKLPYTDKTILELRENCGTIHRLEKPKASNQPPVIVIKNYKTKHPIDMGDTTMILNEV